VRVGRYGAGAFSGYFDGSIDEVRIYNRSLSDDQILALYNNRTDLIVSNETQLNDVWQVAVTPNDGEADGTTVLSNNITILGASFIPPNSSESDGPLGTDLSTFNETTIQNVTDFIWHAAGDAIIHFKESINMSNISSLDNIFEVGDRFVTVNSTLASQFNISANITFTGISCSLCNENEIIYASGSFGTRGAIQANGVSCGLVNKCSNFQCVGTGNAANCSLDVTSFTGFAAGGNANLTINDSEEGGFSITGISIDFFATYINASDGVIIKPSSCSVSFDDGSGPFSMTFNGSGDGQHNYTKNAGFATTGLHDWNVTCTATGFTNLTATDDIQIFSSGDIPEWDDYALLMILIVAIGGYFIRKRQYSN